jgi:hypothetical protein
MKLIIILMIALTIVSNASDLKEKLEKYLKEFKEAPCGKNITNKIDKCEKDGLQVMKIAKDIRPQCCAVWKTIECVEKKAKEKCEKEDLPRIEGLIKSDVGLLEANECKNHKKDSAKCNSSSSFKIDSFLIIFIILFGISFK